MHFLSDRERQVVAAVAALATGNPFLPERIENERRALGDGFQAARDRAYEGCGLIRFEGAYKRSDIAHRALGRSAAT